jgi:hypothetical protein
MDVNVQSFPSMPFHPTILSRYKLSVDSVLYFSNVEDQGGSFNLTDIDPKYTETYVKTTINDFVVGLISDQIWPKLAEIYLHAGKTKEGLTAKLKYVSTPLLSVYGFVPASDYTPVGPFLGLKGSSSPDKKYMETGYLPVTYTGFHEGGASVSLISYVSLTSLGDGDDFNEDAGWGANDQSSATYWTQNPGWKSSGFGYAPSYKTHIGKGLLSSSINIPYSEIGGCIISTRLNNIISLYRDGTLLSSKIDNPLNVEIPKIARIRLYTGNGNTPVQSNTSRHRFAFNAFGQGLTTEEVEILTDRVNTLMTKLGSTIT